VSEDFGAARERRPLSELPPLLGWEPWPPPRIVVTAGSTMIDVERLAGQGAPEGSVVVAEEQTAGRGRRGRHWESPQYAGLWMSLLLRPERSIDRVGWLPLVVGVGVVRALRAVAGVDVRLKWPNDVVVVRDGEVGKVAGLLAERLADGAVIIGLGVNVSQEVDELPLGGTSLQREGARASREDVLAGVLAEVASAYRSWRDGVDFAPLYAEFSATIGRRVRVQRPGGDVVGVAAALGHGGELVVVDDEGGEYAITAGDVVHLRPANEAFG